MNVIYNLIERKGILLITIANAERILAANNPSSQKSRPHTLFASGPPTLQSVGQANGHVGGAVPPRPFANGAPPPPPIPSIRPPPPQAAAYPPVQVPGQGGWPGQPQQLGQPIPQPMMPPPPVQYRPPPPNMPPPPQQAGNILPRPPPQPMAMGGQPPVWRPPPPPQQQMGRPPMMSMPPPPPS